VHYVIIGNGGAGTSALTTIREVDPDSDITILSKEKYPAYSPCSLPNLLSGEINGECVFRFDEDFYSRLNARFLKSAEALRIRPRKKTVELADGKQLTFDRLLISAGAKPITPKGMKGIGLEGVHIMGTLDSILGIIDHLDHGGVKKAVVVGGGFMGIETGTMLKKRGVDVTIVELLPRVLSRMLDPDVSKRVESILQGNGIELMLNTSVESIVGENRVEGVLLGKKKKKISCDMVVIAIGVAPNLAILTGSGTKANRGILVDQNMRTSVKDIYAAGDITEVREVIQGNVGSYAIWPNAIEQGRVAALNMAGIPTEYDGAEMVNILDVFGTPVVAMGGTTETIGKGNDREEIVREYSHSYRKLLLRDNRILGLQFVGDVRNTGPFYSLMKEGIDVGSLKDRLLDENFVHLPDAMLS
jgi:NAD(P)H-nitrite reductase large subunit